MPTQTPGVYFWRVSEEPFGVLSQWAKSPFIDRDGTCWETMEQFIMAMKAKTFSDTMRYNLIRQAKTPSECKALGRQVQNFNVAVWKKKAPFYAFIGNKMKFEQNPQLCAVLRSTGELPIFEASPLDPIWGIGLSAAQAQTRHPADYPGSNLLGKTLVKVRSSLQKDAAK